jgi:hypothetical protein
MTVPPLGDPATEWQRSQPDIVVFRPKGDQPDTDNEHFLVFEAPGGNELLAIWTQSSVEGHGDNHIVFSRSADGIHWADPVVIAGKYPGVDARQASWAFPVVADTGRIYCFFTKETPKTDMRQHCGVMGCVYSDDSGHTWQVGADQPVPKNQYDNPDPEIPPNWIVWQKPIRDSQGRWFTGYTQWSSHQVVPPPTRNWVDQDSRAGFLRFDNLHTGPDPADLRLTWLPANGEGLVVLHREYPQIVVAEEPAVALLPDGRIFAVMRTMTGYIWYSVSDDDGASWREPQMLRYRDGGEGVKNPMVSCPIYRLANGRYLLIFYNNDGRLNGYNQFKKDWQGINQANFLRRPAYIAVGEYRPNAHQPIWFSAPEVLFDTDGIPIGPKKTAEIATYPSLTEWRGERVLWYPDRKFYLLGKRLPDSALARFVVPE